MRCRVRVPLCDNITTKSQTVNYICRILSWKGGDISINKYMYLFVYRYDYERGQACFARSRSGVVFLFAILIPIGILHKSLTNALTLTVLLKFTKNASLFALSSFILVEACCFVVRIAELRSNLS